MIAEAVRQACERGVGYLLYESYVYGRNVSSTLTEFKRQNGFLRYDVPRYFVPLTWKGRCVVRLGLHRPLSDRVPDRLAAIWRNVRTRLVHVVHRG
jgi:hypothetical protein